MRSVVKSAMSIDDLAEIAVIAGDMANRGIRAREVLLLEVLRLRRCWKGVEDEVGERGQQNSDQELV